MENLTKHSNRIWLLIARSLSRESTHEEETELFQILEKDTSLLKQYDVLKKLWHSAKEIKYQEDDFADKEKISHILQLATVETALNKPPANQLVPLKIKRLFLQIGSIAALFIVLFGIYFLIIQNNISKSESSKTETKVVAVENGSRTRTNLPDGSTVWLNAGSKIYFERDFLGATREVKLEGEAYFDVVKNPDRPFIVHTSGIDIRVLGTAFNVKSYPEDKTIETTLIRGLVQVTSKNNPKQFPIFLHPNEKLIVIKPANDSLVGLTEKVAYSKNQSLNIYSIQKIDIPTNKKEPLEMAWINNRLEFKGDNFEDLAQKLERWYNINIIFKDETVKQLNFTGTFENENISQAFSALKAAEPFNFEIVGHEIFISSSD